MKICVICVEKIDYAPRRIFEEGRKMGHSMHMTSWMDIIVDINSARIRIGDRKVSLDYFDAIIPRSPSFIIREKNKKVVKKLGTLLKLIIEYAKVNKIAVLNDRYFTNYFSLDKLTQQFFFFSNGIPGLPTEYFSRIPRKIKYPFIAKTAQGSLGSGVFKISKKAEMEKIVSESDKTGKSFIYQKYFSIDCDYRVLVVAGKAVGVMKRVPKANEWRTNVSLGGSACAVNGGVSEKIKRLGEKTASKMFLDYVGVDILEHKGICRVIEVNSLAQFEGFEKACPEINVARKIIGVMEKKASKFSRK